MDWPLTDTTKECPSDLSSSSFNNPAAATIAAGLLMARLGSVNGLIEQAAVVPRRPKPRQKEVHL
jgi:hypothetical protein